MAIEEHPSFDQPPVTVGLWRYTDLPKFIELMISRSLWLANAEVLAVDDPYEGRFGAMQFPHRRWRSIDDLPEVLRVQLDERYRGESDGTRESIFNSWFMTEEQQCIISNAGRRNFYVSCWHAAHHESVAMWKIYGAPGAGVAILTNAGRMNASLAANDLGMHLGAVQYADANTFVIGATNVFDALMKKRASYAYEQEVRIVHWNTGDSHDPLVNFEWNENTLRFANVVDDPRPVTPGLSVECDIGVMIEQVIVSPFAPSWYVSMIERLRDILGYSFPVTGSLLLEAPPLLP